MIDLIEYFGGYEQAKEVALEAKKGIDPVIYVNGEEVLIDFLTDQMLAYRRQNNIFEVGDLATHLTTRAILRVVSVEDSNKHYRFIQVEALNPKNDGSVSDCFNSLWFQLRHATNAEIEANRRLDLPKSVVKSLGEVS